MPSRGWIPPSPRVAIVGGGLAGLATAVALVGYDLEVMLFESRPRLGGRASSFADSAAGELVDNCQHVSMGCCVNLKDFCQRLDVPDAFHRDPTIRIMDRSGRISRLKAGWLPAPLHLFPSFLRLRFLSAFEKLRLARGVMALARAPNAPSSEPLSDWLVRHRQSRRLIERFWSLILVSALNEDVDRIDIGLARKVIVDGLMKTRHGYELRIPRAPLGEIFDLPARDWLSRHHVAYRLTMGVREVEIDDDGAASAIRLRDGERIPADFIVIAVPFQRVWGLLSSRGRGLLPELQAWEDAEASPITGVHLWFDRPVFALNHLAFTDRVIQWIFNHTAIQGRAPANAPDGQYLQIVISASRSLAGLTKEATLDAVLRDLAAICPEARRERLTAWRVVTERSATFSPRPGIDQVRPYQRTAVEGLLLAGDWTATGWPATMEGAVRSGYLAAEEILARLGRRVLVVKPDPPQNLLSRWLLRPRWLSGSFAGASVTAPAQAPALLIKRGDDDPAAIAVAEDHAAAS